MVKRANKIHLFKIISKGILIDRIIKVNFFIYFVIHYTYNTHYTYKEVCYGSALRKNITLSEEENQIIQDFCKK